METTGITPSNSSGDCIHIAFAETRNGNSLIIIYGVNGWEVTNTREFMKSVIY
jgi:hypothetical protein